MRRVAIAGLLLALAPVSDAAAAAPVLVMDGGRVEERRDPFVPATTFPPARGAAPPARLALSRAGLSARRTVEGELLRMLDGGAIDLPTYEARKATLGAARKTRKRLSGRRRIELGATISNLEEIAQDGMLTVSRLPALFLTVERNRQWWTTGPLLKPTQRVSFAGSHMVWQYYPGQGIQIQMLGSFGKANGLWASGDHDPEFRALLDELVGLVAQRGDGLAWEYYFHFDGGRPPWTSALSQGTAIQALARGALRLGNPPYFEIARQGLAPFRAAPPTGVRVATPAGARYIIYSFAPKLRVINAFAQSLVGLYDFAGLANDQPARELFAAGDAQAQRELGDFDTGAWSYYSPGKESSLNYHTLVRDFLKNLCKRTATPLYCATGERFTGYLRTAPVIALVSTRARGGQRAPLRFRLSKISRVGVVVARGGRAAFASSALVGHGRRSLRWRAPRKPGIYTVRLRAADLAGNVSSATGKIRVLAPR